MKKTQFKKSFQPTRLSEQIGDYLSSEIRSNKIPIGEALPSENALAKSLGVSRTVIREALVRLKFEGLIETHQGLGAIVTGDQNAKFFRLDSLKDHSLSDWNHLFELRTILETEAAYLAANRADEDDLIQLEKLLEELSVAIKEKQDGTIPDIKFHRAVAKASKNPHLESLMNFLLDTVLTEILNYWELMREKPERYTEIYKEHELIYLAIRSQDTKRARKAVMNHLKNSIENLRKIKFPTD